MEWEHWVAGLRDAAIISFYNQADRDEGMIGRWVLRIRIWLVRHCAYQELRALILFRVGWCAVNGNCRDEYGTWVWSSQHQLGETWALCTSWICVIENEIISHQRILLKVRRDCTVPGKVAHTDFSNRMLRLSKHPFTEGTMTVYLLALYYICERSLQSRFSIQQEITSLEKESEWDILLPVVTKDRERWHYY